MPCDDCRTGTCPDQERARWVRQHLLQSLTMPRRFPSVRDLLLANLVVRAGLAGRTEDAHDSDLEREGYEETGPGHALPDAQEEPLSEQPRRPERQEQVVPGGYL
jgi:hypothetical protein